MVLSAPECGLKFLDQYCGRGVGGGKKAIRFTVRSRTNTARLQQVTSVVTKKSAGMILNHKTA